jgi:hypothetical protein
MNKFEMLKQVALKYPRSVEENGCYSLMGTTANLLKGINTKARYSTIEQMNVFFNCSKLFPSRGKLDTPSVFEIEELYDGISSSKFNNLIDFMKKHQ